MKKTLFFFIALLSLFACSHEETISSPSDQNPKYKQALAYLNAGKIDSAFYYYAFAKEDFLKKKDTFNLAKCLINMAIIQTDKADIYGGIETSLEAEKLLQKKNRLYNELKSSNYNNLAIANANLENFQHAEKYYLLAIQNTKDTPSKDIYYNNLACNYESMGQYKKAEEFYSLALKTKDSISYARALNNYARCLFLENKGNQNLIKSYLNKALSIREKKNNNWDLNSSYATLSEYYKKSNPEKAIFYAEKMYEIAHKITIQTISLMH